MMEPCGLQGKGLLGVGTALHPKTCGSGEALACACVHSLHAQGSCVHVSLIYLGPLDARQPFTIWACGCRICLNDKGLWVQGLPQ